MWSNKLRSSPPGRTCTGASSVPLRSPSPRCSMRRKITMDKGTVEFLWAIFDSMGPEAGEEEWPTPEDLDPDLVYQDVLVSRYKDRNVDGSVLFAAVEYCSHVVQHEGKPDMWRLKERKAGDVPKIMQAVLAARVDLNAEASHKKGRMCAIHYAAGLGAVPVLEALLEAMVERAPVQMSREECTKNALNMRTLNETNVEHYTPLHDAVWFKRYQATEWLLSHKADPNAQNIAGWTPMHIVAMHGQSLEFVELLIRHGADLRTKDLSGNNPLTTAVNKPLFPLSKFHLLAASCYETKGSFLAYLRDIYTLALENEQAAEEFVQVLLGTHRTGEVAANDQQDWEASESSTDSKGMLKEERPLRFTQSVDSATARSGKESEKALAMMAEVMEKAPRAAAMILDVLVGAPMVQCPEHHPVPLRANMLLDGCEETMICDYQPDVFEEEDDEDHEMSWMSRVSLSRTHQKRSPHQKQVPETSPMGRAGALGREVPGGLGADSSENWWALAQRNLLPKVAVVEQMKREVSLERKEGRKVRHKVRVPCWGYDTLTNTAPSWHTSIAPMMEKRNDDKEVQVQVLKMPDILDVRVVRVLANTKHLSLFAEKTVQGIVNCLWHQLVKHGVRWAIVLDVTLLVTLLAWIFVAEAQEDSLVPLRQSYWLTVLATGLKELLNLMYSLYLFHMLERSVLSYLFYGDVMVDFVATCATLLLAASTRDDLMVPRVGWRRSLVALNVLMRWFQITYKCRPFSKVGKKLVCVLKSFMPMKEMMCITAVVFFGFGVAVLLIKDNSLMDCEDHCSAVVLMDLFKALLMGDGDGFDDLTKLPGGDPEGVFAGGLVLLATLVFSVSVLNLLIAVYSNEYDRKEKQSDLLFFQERAGICFRHLMEPLWSNWRKRPAWLWRRWELWRGQFLPPEERDASASAFAKFAVAGTVCCFWVLGLLLGELLGWSGAAVACLVVAMLLVEVASKRCDWQHPCRADGGDHFYLWICSRTVFGKGDFQEEDSSRNTQDVLAALRQMSRSMDKQMGELKEGLQAVDARVDEVHRQLAAASLASAPSPQLALRLPVPQRTTPNVVPTPRTGAAAPKGAPAAKEELRRERGDLERKVTEEDERQRQLRQELASAATLRIAVAPAAPSGSVPNRLRPPDSARRANHGTQLPLSGHASPASPLPPLSDRSAPVSPLPVQAHTPRVVGRRVHPPERPAEASVSHAGHRGLLAQSRPMSEEASPSRFAHKRQPNQKAVGVGCGGCGL